MEEAFAERRRRDRLRDHRGVPGQHGRRAAAGRASTPRLRELCTAHGALLIIDEVLTGFRVSRSGWYGLDPVDADLMTFGKVMGGGLPAAAFGGRADVMAQLAPEGPVYQAGTLSGNPLACAAGLATLRACDDGVYARVDAAAADDRPTPAPRRWPPRACRTGCSARAACSRSSSPRTQVTDFAGARRQNTAAYTAFFHAMLDQGVYLPPSAYEAWFLSAAHDDAASRRSSTRCPRPPRPPPRHRRAASRWGRSPRAYRPPEADGRRHAAAVCGRPRIAGGVTGGRPGRAGARACGRSPCRTRVVALPCGAGAGSRAPSRVRRGARRTRENPWEGRANVRGGRPLRPSLISPVPRGSRPTRGPAGGRVRRYDRRIGRRPGAFAGPCGGLPCPAPLPGAPLACLGGEVGAVPAPGPRPGRPVTFPRAARRTARPEAGRPRAGSALTPRTAPAVPAGSPPRAAGPARDGGRLGRSARARRPPPRGDGGGRRGCCVPRRRGRRG